MVESRIDKIALVTGASSGIGLEYARELCARGYDVVLVSNEEERLGEVAELLAKTYGKRTWSVYMDLAQVDAAGRLYAYCKEKELEIEVLVNNAGVFRLEEVVESPSSVVERMLMLHVVTGTMLCRYFGEEMKRRERGYILNMSSLSAWFPYPGIALYASTKCFLKGFSRAFRLEMKDYGVSVTTVCPGAIATDLYHLSHRLQTLAVNLGVMMTPRQLARRAIRGMFHRRARMVPGVFNYLLMGILLCLPGECVRWGMRKSGLLPKRETRLNSAESDGLKIE